MSTSHNNQNRKDPVLEDYQQVHHEKNAFVAGDRVYMWKNIKGKPIKVWRIVKSVDSVEGKLYLEDSKRGITIYAPNEKKHDNIITTDAWEKAFALINDVWNEEQARKNREKCVVSCETVEGHPCVVISNSKDINVQTRWYIRRDYWSLLKKESISQKYKKLSLAPGQSIPSTATEEAIKKFGRVVIKPEWCDIIQQKGKSPMAVWNAQCFWEINEACPWLIYCDTWWNVPNSNKPKFMKARQRKQS